MSRAEIAKVTSKIMRRRMATKLTRELGLDAAVEMGEWSSRAMAKLYVEDEDVLATSTCNKTDVMLGGASKRKDAPSAEQEKELLMVRQDREVATALSMATETAAILTAAAEEMPEARVELPPPMLPVSAAGTGGTLANDGRISTALLIALEGVRQAVQNKEPAPKARVAYGTLEVSAAVQAQRERQNAVCHPERIGGNPLKRKVLSDEVVQLIDSMATSTPEDIQKVLCTTAGIKLCTSRAEIERFRQPRFKAAGGREAFIASRC